MYCFLSYLHPVEDIKDILNKDQLVENATKSYLYYIEQALFFKSVIEAAGGVVPSLKSVPTYETKLQKRSNTGISFVDTIVEILKEQDKPLTTQDILSLASAKGRKISSLSNFNSQLNSTYVNKKRFYKTKVKDKIFWGLPNWFNGTSFIAEKAELLGET